MKPEKYDELTPTEAVQLQKKLAHKLRLEPLDVSQINRIAAVDVSYSRTTGNSYAAAVLWDVAAGEAVQFAGAVARTSFPYIPGLLAFREIPPLTRALSQLPGFDLILCDGHGITHPRGFGLASHLGVLYGKPSIGLAKKLLCGSFEMPPSDQHSYTPVFINESVAGYALRTRKNTRPVFVSPGHLCDPESALQFVLLISGKYRLPDPLRLAHSYTVQLRKTHE